MAVFDSPISTALRGRPSLRRGVSQLGSARREQVETQLADIDPKRFKSLYRDRLKQIVQNDNMAQPALERQAIEEKLKDPNIGVKGREALQKSLRTMGGGFGTIAQREDPFRYGSIAQREFGSLYRS